MESIVEKVIRKHDMAVIACSFGRDSMVVLHMVIEECRKQNKPFKIIWNDTGVEYSDQYEFNNRIIKEWDLEEHLIIAKSKYSFWQVKDKYGLPILPRAKSEATQMCCEILKKIPTKLALEKFKGSNYVYLTGLNAFESNLRMENAKKYGVYFYAKSWKHYKCHPILFWNDQMIDEYILDHNIPLCNIYSLNGIKGYKVRNGCWCCPQGWQYGKGKWLKKYYPKFYKYMVTKTELGRYILSKKIHVDELPSGYVEHIFESRPCFFEKF